MGVAQNIRRLRLDAGLTQEQLAARLGVARTTIAQWESGSSHPRYAMMTKLAQDFGVDRSVIVAEGPSGSPTLAQHAAPATVPLVTLDASQAGDCPVLSASGTRIEVPAWVLAEHPQAQATLVQGDDLDRVAPAGMAVVFDPDLSPANGSIAPVATQDHGLLMRRWFRGGNTLMLVADSHTTRDDIIIFSNEPVHVLGTVVLALSPAPLS